MNDNNLPPNSEIDSAVRNKVAALKTLQKVSQTLASELNLTKLLRGIIHSAVEILNATTGSLLIWDHNDDTLVFAVTEGAEGQKLENHRISTRDGIAGWIFTYRQPVIVDDVRKDGRFFSAIDESLGHHTTSLIGVPLMTKGEMIGIIEVLNKKSGEKFDDHDLEMLSALASHAAIAIKNARLYHALREERDRIVAIEEQVRKRLARDLHDGPAQTLASMLMSIDFIRQAQKKDPSQVEAELESLEQAAKKTLQQVRNMLFELRPVVLEAEGLEAALRAYVERLREVDEMPIHSSLKGLKERVPPKVEEVIFAIVQEALGNIRKHAQARNVWLTVARSGGALTVMIKDDGIGFDKQEVGKSYATKGSLGLLNIRERAEMLGGRASIKSRPGKGASVTLVVPLHQKGSAPRPSTD